MLVVGLIYSKILNGFFQQDEWFSFGWYVIHKNLNWVERLVFVFAPNIGHYNPLTNLLQDRLYALWGMNYFNFAAVGILLHMVVVLTFYFFAKLFFGKNKLLPFLATILFGLTASIHQGVSWVVADLSTLIASIFGLLSAMVFLKFVGNKKTKYLISSILLLITSLLFKEVSIGLFLLYIVYLFLYDKSKSRFKDIALVLFFALIYFFTRVAMLFLPGITNDKLVTASQSTNLIFYNFATIPLKIITQILVPSDFLMGISKYMSNFYSVNGVMSFLSITGGLVASILIVKFLYQRKYLANHNKILFGFGWVVLNSFIFSLSPETSGAIVAVDSRNLYFVAMGMSLLVVIILNILTKGDAKKTILISLLLLIFNLYWLNSNLNKVVLPGQTRKAILNQIKSDYPDLPDKTIFFVSSDTSYYGLAGEDKIPPFQSGFGQTLLAWYFSGENFPGTFYKDRFLWDIKSQGYKEGGGRGFGYFRDFGLLKQTIKEYNLPVDSVVSYSWNSKLQWLTNTTEEVRLKLTKND